MWENKGHSSCYGDEPTTKTSCNKTCKYATNPNESHRKKEATQTMEGDQIQPTVTGWLARTGQNGNMVGIAITGSKLPLLALT
jgi:sulfatase maturation enzyme AslB (radical SAM superfamily)